MSKQGKIIGIDLGTTNSVVSVMEGGEAVVITNAEGARTTPSVVAFSGDGGRLVGASARRQAVTNPKRTISSIKRFMGRRHSEVGNDETRVAYDLVGGPEDLVKVSVDGQEFTPPEISSNVLKHLKEAAEAYLGEEVTRAVITVPAYFNDSQRQATKDAGTIAGLEVERILNEPTAATLAYGLDKNKSGRVAVYDLGGGTFDISILEIGDGVFEVLSTNGDTQLGGDDFDEALIAHVSDQFQAEAGIDVRQDPMALQRLKEACEKAKCELSSSVQTDINLPFITADASGPKHLQVNLTRAKFDQLTEGLLARSRKPVMQALKDSGLKASEIDDVILVGGSTRIPAVQAMVEEIFGREPNRSVNPDEVVATGAAVQGGVLGGEVSDVVLLDVTPLSLGIETLGGVFTKLVERNTTIPTSKSQVFSTAADNQPSVDIVVYQGEREMAASNRKLGNFQLNDIPPSQRGVPQIEVSFDIDADGIVSVKASDKGTGKIQSIVIKDASGLSEEEVDRMRKEAEAHADEDKAARELVDVKNQVEQIVHQTDKHLEEHGEKLGEEEVQSIKTAGEELKKLAEGDDKEALEKGLEEFAKTSQKLGELLYAEAQAEAEAGAEGAPEAPGAPEGAGDSGEEPVDADFEVKA